MASTSMRRLWVSPSFLSQCCRCSCAHSAVSVQPRLLRWSSCTPQPRTKPPLPSDPRIRSFATTRRRAATPSSPPSEPRSFSLHPARTSVYSWGSGAFGGLGCSSYRPHPSPQLVPTLSSLPSPIVSLSSGWTSNLALTSSGCVYHWGYKPFLRSLALTARLHKRVPSLLASLQSLNLGRFSLSNATTTPTPLPPFVPSSPSTPTTPSTPATRISCGGDFAAIVDAHGQLHTFGSGFFGQLGHSSKLADTFVREPRLVEALREEGVRVKEVACGFHHLLILAEDGRVYVCGKHDHGALGIGKVLKEGKRLFYPHLVPSTCRDPHARLSLDPADAERKTMASLEPAPHYIGEVVQVSAGMKHSLLLTKEGKVYASGHNQFGQCGFSPLDLTSAAPTSSLSSSAPLTSSTFLSLSTFTRISSLKPHRVTSLSAGQHHSLFLTDTGLTLACGLNQQQQCGQPTSMATLRASAAVSKWTQKQFECVAEPREVEVGGVEGVKVVGGFYDSVLVGKTGEVVWWGGRMKQEGERGKVEGVMGGKRVRDVSFGFVHSLILTDEDGPAAVSTAGDGGADSPTVAAHDPRPRWY